MELLSAQNCYFNRVENKAKICLLSKKLCLFCPFKVPKIEGLEVKDYVSLSFSKSSFVATSIIAIIATLISFSAVIISLLIKQSSG